MNVAILGYGKMGKEIEKIALSRGHKITLTSSSQRPFYPTDLIEKRVDVAIEFTEPKSAISNIYKCFEANVPVVVGTTGWYERLDEVKDNCKSNNQSLFYASNFSIGVNIFFKINEILATYMDHFESYEPSMKEIHHTEKKDAPSGTALTLVEEIIHQLKRKDSWTDRENWDDTEISLVSERTKDVPGTHEVVYESAEDVIKLEHIAKGRTGFALGSVRAAEWLVERKGAYTMRDMLKL